MSECQKCGWCCCNMILEISGVDLLRETRAEGQLTTVFFTAYQTDRKIFINLADRFDVTLEEITWPEGAEHEHIEIVYPGTPLGWKARHES